MKIALIYPPTCDPTAPYLAVPMLTGFLRAHGVQVVPIDANVEAYDELLRPEPLAEVRDRIELSIEGGREQGFRTWSRKRNFGDDPRGRWTCAVETGLGQSLGEQAIVIEP